MLSTNFITISEKVMNDIAEASRNIELLEQSIHMTSSPSQADAADYMISEETGRKRQLVNHLRELSVECSERRNEIAALRNSAIEESMTYARIAAKFQAANNQESYEEAMKLRNKARKEYDDYSILADQLAALSTEINNTLAGETLPRLLPLTNLADLPFESQAAWRNPSAKQISREEFAAAVNAMLQKQDVIASIETYCGIDSTQLAASLAENSPSDKQKVKSALESVIYDNAEDEATADALTDAINVYFDSVVDDVQEALEEFDALPSQRRVNLNIGIRA